MRTDRTPYSTFPVRRVGPSDMGFSLSLVILSSMTHSTSRPPAGPAGGAASGAYPAALSRIPVLIVYSGYAV